MSAVVLRRASPGNVHKFVVAFPDGTKVRFGRRGYSDFTMHKDPKRMARYVIRHKRRENWTRSGAKTAGFWSRWLLWSKPGIQAALKQTQRVLGKKIVFKK